MSILSIKTHCTNLSTRCVLIKFLLLIMFFFLGCSYIYGFTPIYEILSPDNQLKAQIGHRSNDFWIKILKAENEIVFDELHPTNYEVGVDNVQWSPDSSMFAIKLVGYDSWTQIKIYDLNSKKKITLSNKEHLEGYGWLELDLNYTIANEPIDHLENYKIKDRGRS